MRKEARVTGPPLSPPARIGLCALGLGVGLYSLLALQGESWRAYDGWPTSQALLPFSLGLALAVVGLGIGTELLGSALWFALGLLGFSAALQLIEAGPIVRYQKLLQPKVWGAQQAPALGLIALQAVLVGLGLRGRLRAIARGIEAHAPGWRWPLILLAVYLASANELWKTRGEWLLEMSLVFGLSLLCLANVLLVAFALPSGWIEALTRRIERPAPGPGLDPVAKRAALWCGLVSLFLGWLSYDWHPHIPDEVAYLFHARYFAAGALYVPPPPVPEAFAADLLLLEPERLYSPVPPGWPALLALGVRLGVPWLLNPLLGAVCALLLFSLVQRIYGLVEARWSVLLLCLSPWFLFVSMSIMTHNSSLAMALIAALCVARLREGAHLGYAALGGLSIGGVSLVRPLEGAIVALLLGLWCLLQRGQPVFRLILRSAVLTVCTIAVGLLVVPYNIFFTGQAFYFPIMAYVDRLHAPGANNLGFGPDRGMGWRGLDPNPGHDLRDMLLNTDLNVFAVNVELLGWPTGSILPLALATFVRKLKAQDLWMLAVIVTVSGVHGLYWFSGGPDFGARYWYLVIVPCVVLCARGVLGLASSLQARWPDAQGVRARALGGALAASLLAMLVFMPWRVVDKYHNYRGSRAQFYRLLKARKVEGGLVLLYGDKHPDYGPAMVMNPLRPKAQLDQPLVAWDRRPELSAQVIDAYPERPVWLVEGPSVTKQDYRIVQGPLSAADAKVALERRWRDRKKRH